MRRKQKVTLLLHIFCTIFFGVACGINKKFLGEIYRASIWQYTLVRPCFTYFLAYCICVAWITFFTVQVCIKRYHGLVTFYNFMMIIYVLGLIIIGYSFVLRATTCKAINDISRYIYLYLTSEINRYMACTLGIIKGFLSVGREQIPITDINKK